MHTLPHLELESILEANHSKLFFCFLLDAFLVYLTADLISVSLYQLG